MHLEYSGVDVLDGVAANVVNGDMLLDKVRIQ